MPKVSPLITGLENEQFKPGEVPAITIRGRMGFSPGLGANTLGRARYGEYQPHAGIYQKRVTGYNQTGRIPGRARRAYYVRTRYYAPTNPRTVKQQAHRQKFADAVAAWQLLTPAEKHVYNQQAKRPGQHGYSRFISWYLKNH